MSVYVITDGTGAIKIGKANDVRKRINMLQTGNPRKLVVLFRFVLQNTSIVDDNYLESFLHEKYAEYRIGKTEWFDAGCVWYLTAEQLFDWSLYYDVPVQMIEKLIYKNINEITTCTPFR